MPLLKKECICSSCNTQFIVVMEADDYPNLSSCPFCTFPLEDEDSGDEEE